MTERGLKNINVFYSTFTNVFFYFCHVFYVFNVFYFVWNVFYIYARRHSVCIGNWLGAQREDVHLIDTKSR